MLHELSTDSTHMIMISEAGGQSTDGIKSEISRDPGSENSSEQKRSQSAPAGRSFCVRGINIC